MFFIVLLLIRMMINRRELIRMMFYHKKAELQCLDGNEQVLRQILESKLINDLY